MFNHCFNREDLCQLIVKRIGLDTFIDKLVAITKNEHYSRAAQNPHLKFKDPSEVLFDYEFCRLFKSLEGIFYTLFIIIFKKVLNLYIKKACLCFYNYQY